MNLILLTDSYKVSHHKQYPPGTTGVYSYFESRGGQFREVAFFGLQYFLKHYLRGPRITREHIDEAEALFRVHLGDASIFHREGWEHIVAQHGGRLPVSVRAVPEGTVVPTHNVLITIENTDPACYWLTNYLETLLVQVWYPCTVATQSREMKKVILANLEATGTPALADFKLQDFGFRGVSSVETAGLGAAAHLLSFRGTDTFAGVLLARNYYRADMPGFSIPAAEHSTITSWGRGGEADAYANMLRQFPGTVAVVSDSYDVFHACAELWGTQLEEQVLHHKGTLVIRPDSGDPLEVLPRVLDILGEKFGSVANAKGYRVLNDKVRIIQGDGIDFESLGVILDRLKECRWSGDNIAFGSGGGLLQKLNRDTLKFAFKCSSATVNGQPRDVFKQPVTDPGKKSKSGRLKLIAGPGGYETVREEVPGRNVLEEVFRDGELLRDQDFETIRGRAAIPSPDRPPR